MPTRIIGRVYSTATALLWRGRLHSLGKGVYLHHTSNFVRPSRIAIGPRVTLFRGARIEAVGAGPAPQVVLGEKVSIQRDVHIGACQSVEILEGTVFGSGVYVTDHDHDYRDPKRGYFGTGELLAAPVRIGPRAWIGERAIILKGVTIGEGAIVGAGALVNRDVPAFCIAVGVPARVIRRFDFERGQWVAA
jgi:lipopolysaccharide O-acetyltransferase